MCIAIIADDLTGASDTAVKMKNEGDVRVFFQPPESEELSELPQVFAINTNSRMLSGSEAYKIVYRTASQLKKAGVENYYKKIDSLYRGNVIKETEAMIDVLGVDLAIVAPAAPQNDRRIINGLLVSQNGNADGSVLRLMSRGTGKQFAAIPLSVIKKGPEAILNELEKKYESGAQIVLMDSEKEEDLETIASACERLKHSFLPVGTSGFISCLKKYWGLEDRDPQEAPPAACRGGTLLYVIGTYHPITVQQIEALIQTERTVPVFVKVASCFDKEKESEISRVLRAAEEKLEKNPDVLLIAVDSVRNDPIQVDQDAGVRNGEISCSEITECISKIAGTLLKRHVFSGILLSGGDTAQSVFKAIGVTEMRPLCEVLPGIAVGEIRIPGSNDTYVATKSGGFGDRDALLAIKNFFQK